MPLDEPTSVDSPAGGLHRAPLSAESVRKRGSKAKVLAAVVAVAILCAAAGIIWWNGPHGRAQADAKRQSSAAAEAGRSAACQDLLSDSYTALQGINSRLDVGMTEADYTEAVGQAQAKYDQVDSSKAATHHCGAYAAMGKILRQYSNASTYWNSCIIDDYCTPSDLKLNQYWSRSSGLLVKIKKNGLGSSKDPTALIPAFGEDG